MAARASHGPMRRAVDRAWGLQPALVGGSGKMDRVSVMQSPDRKFDFGCRVVMGLQGLLDGGGGGGLAPLAFCQLALLSTFVS